MLFNSFSFLIFFPLAFFCYWALPQRFRIAFLFLCSCLFYMVFVPKYILILFTLIIVDFIAARLLAREEGARRKMLLLLSIVSNLAMLGLFKYFNFFSENVAMLAEVIGWNYEPALLMIALPIGLSFHIFQSLSYVIEVYKGEVQPERSLLRYGLYVMFFPQLVAGPIERPQHMLPQFNTVHTFDPTKVRRGLELMGIGFFKKVVIADHLAALVDHLYAGGASGNGAALAIAAVAFSYQLYCDFSGYSDIAVGAALVFGYDLTQNFNRPFASRSVAEFWRRWHISLSSWLRDYVYYPLVFVGARISPMRLYGSLFVTFTLIGLWHGANWTYVVMGALHGVYLIVGSITQTLRASLARFFWLSRFSKIHGMFQIGITFFLVTISFIFFRAESMTHALEIVSGIVRAPLDLFSLFEHWSAIITPGSMGIGLMWVLIAVILLEGLQYLQAKRNTPFVFETSPRTIRVAWYYGLALAILWFGYFGEKTFIYFQF